IFAAVFLLLPVWLLFYDRTAARQAGEETRLRRLDLRPSAACIPNRSCPVQSPFHTSAQPARFPCPSDRSVSHNREEFLGLEWKPSPRTETRSFPASCDGFEWCNPYLRR